MRLIVSVGSYERVVYGIDVDVTRDGLQEKGQKDRGTMRATGVKESFAIPAHIGCVKAIASCPRFLASGATDETVRIFDLRKRRDIGSLSQHNGSVHALAFAGATHLLTGGEDGRIALFRTKDWECLHVLRHKKPVHSIAVHPSGKIALSVGKERSLRLWNLMTGKQAHSAVLPHEPRRIVFSESGGRYAVLADNSVLVYTTDGCRLLLEHKSPTRLATAAFLRDDRLYFAGEGAAVSFIDLHRSVPGGDAAAAVTVTVHSFPADQSPRIKDLAVVASSFGDILVTGSSAGVIKGWALPDHTELFSHPSRIRITCLTASVQ